MKCYDIDSTAVWLILDEMEELLEGDQLLIFRALREGVSRREIAENWGISKNAVNCRIKRIRKRIRKHYHELDLPRVYHIENLF